MRSLTLITRKQGNMKVGQIFSSEPEGTRLKRWALKQCLQICLEEAHLGEIVLTELNFKEGEEE